MLAHALLSLRLYTHFRIISLCARKTDRSHLFTAIKTLSIISTLRMERITSIIWCQWSKSTHIFSCFFFLFMNRSFQVFSNILLFVHCIPLLFTVAIVQHHGKYLKKWAFYSMLQCSNVRITNASVATHSAQETGSYEVETYFGVGKIKQEKFWEFSNDKKKTGSKMSTRSKRRRIEWKKKPPEYIAGYWFQCDMANYHIIVVLSSIWFPLLRFHSICVLLCYKPLAVRTNNNVVCVWCGLYFFVGACCS